jgi:hypothetical protein
MGKVYVPKPGTPIPHGTAGGYTNHRCRCSLCREAWRLDHLDYMNNRHPEQLEKHRVRQRAYHAAKIAAGFKVVDGRYVKP